MAKLKSLVGKRFGLLTVVSRSFDKQYQGQHRTFWLCKCDCGKETITQGASLKTGVTKSCGCQWHISKYNDDTMISKNEMFSRIKKSAKMRNHQFDLSFDHVMALCQQKCYYCGDEPNQSITFWGKTNQKFKYHGLDRVDNSKGYTLDNVVPCCGICNRAKYQMPKEKFISWVKRCYNNLVVNNI